MSIDLGNYKPASDLLQNRITLVTGAGDGIGRAVSLALAAHGSTVLLLGRTTRKLESVYDEILAAGGPQPGICPMDFEKATMDDYATLAEAINKEHGRLDGLLHNAGVLGALTPIEHYKPMMWHTVMHVNLNAAFLLTQSLFPLLKQSDDASVVFTSSGVGRKARAHWGAYAVSKFGTEGLMQVLADETSNSQTLRANCINPGKTRTAMRMKAYPGEDRDTLARPEQIVTPYLYLLGPDSRGVTGQSLDAQPT